MGGDQSHAQASPCQHHHHLWRVADVGQILGMAAEGFARIVDDAFVQRRGDHACKLTCHDALVGAVEQINHIRRVVHIQYPYLYLLCHWYVQHFHSVAA